MKTTNYILGIILLSALLFSCKDGTGPDDMFTDNFDRTQMLTDIADHIIIPRYEAYVDDLSNLKSKTSSFVTNPDVNSLQDLQSAYLSAYEIWQQVSMFEIGRAEAIGLRNYSNIYPTDQQGIITNIQSNNFNLELPSNFDTQGFPALDYLLFGTGDSDFDIMQKLSTSDYSQYLDALVDRLFNITNEVLIDWNNGFRNSFIENNGASSTASVDKLVNDFMFYYEKFLRAGKVGIPAGVFSGNTLAHATEAPYSNIHSQRFLIASINSVIDFFEGKSASNGQDFMSIEDYLVYVAEQNQTADIAGEIKSQLETAKNMAMGLSESLKDQVESDNSKMLGTYDELQKAVILMKVDMMQAMNIQIDYVDADGD